MKGTKYPLLFTYHDILAGNGFIAGIRIRGRSLMVEEEDGDVWIYGVNPGGISNGGKSQKEAASAFRSVYQAVLYDIAEEAQTFAELKDEVESFCAETNVPNAQEWRKAVKLVRNGLLGSDWLDRRPADSDRGVEVVEITPCEDAELAVKQRPAPSYNGSDEQLLAA